MLMIVIGTRPEAIKLAPVALAAAADRRMEVAVVRTRQHREMLDPMIEHFGLPVVADLDIMREDQGLAEVTAAALTGLARTIAELRPACVVVQGDTTTAMCGALAASYQRVPVAHVEAGLRTYDRQQPFPEELNRCLTAQLADLHFAPTVGARDNLRREGIDAARIHITGNTAIDALQHTLATLPPPAATTGRQILVTAHRRENHGEPMDRICAALRALVDRFDDVTVRFPVHLSPRVRATVLPRLDDHPRIELEPPLGYPQFVQAMRQAYFIVSDSGGIQEEAPSLGKPVLVLRERTERPEAVEAGCARLVGTQTQRVLEHASALLTDRAAYDAMAGAHNPFGDGTAGAKIVEHLVARFG
ncbi:MAG: UDP-N-acetylglucosamine 2-epimerase (non-hydrolyzing) [Deltaproteobacteria bacterium]|nr:UDP-N-acetylglucosamine 2-epimerase (non-hydrolyzing) [Deltaproteobacteria bacterium]